MSIRVTCTGCHTRFDVHDKFAGKEGPCPKCKARIRIPAADEQVVIHAPDPVGPKDSRGRSILKPISRSETTFSGVQITLIAAGTIAFVAVAVVLRNMIADKANFPLVLLACGAMIIAIPIAYVGYAFLRNQESPPFFRRVLWIRLCVCALIYAVLWLLMPLMAYAFPGNEMGAVIAIVAMIAAGGLIGMLALEFDYLFGVMHYGLYLGACLIGRLVIGLPLFSRVRGSAGGTVDRDFNVADAVGHHLKFSVQLTGRSSIMIPEIAALETRPGVIRIPDQIDVPVTQRVRRLIDSSAFQRLSRISQLGMVAHVYPGARHSRFEHSLGVYRNALLFARRLSQFESFADQVSSEQLEALVVASLLHDIGHWPWCHAIEDIGMPGVPSHQAVAATILNQPELSGLIDSDWSCGVEAVERLIVGDAHSPIEGLLCTILSGPIDVDKMDYLYRDSLHCGVPYGMNFDAGRLINSICPNRAGDRIAISGKGKTAAEMMVFARYVMFSEVYWHHAVRSATAMIQRVFFDWVAGRNTESLFLGRQDDESLARELRQANPSGEASVLVNALFGPQRQLYKRLLDYNAHEHPDIHRRLAHQPYDWQIQCATRLASRLSQRLATPISPFEVLVDAPPMGLEIQFRVEVNNGEENPNMLADISPVVDVLARTQFDDFVKRARVFIHPRLVGLLDPRDSELELLKVLDEPC